MSDFDAVALAQAGDHQAFRVLVERYQGRAHRLALRVLRNDEQARDAVQDAFLKVHSNLARFENRSSFYTWFYRIVMNLAIDALRKLRSARAGSLDDVLGGLSDQRESGESPVEREEQDRAVWTVLERLDAKFRAVLVLRDIHGLSCREIAPILKVTHATARWRLHRGRQMFREHWERMERGGRS